MKFKSAFRLIVTGSPAAYLLAAVTAALLAAPAAQAATDTWNKLLSGNASGSWSTAANPPWSTGALPGSGDTADFSTLDITADSTVTLDGNQSINALIFGDTTPSSAANWILNPGTPGTSILTLAGTTPTITVNAMGTSKTVTIGAVVAGSVGLTKSGSGTLALSAANTYSGATVISQGTLKLAAATSLTVPGSVVWLDATQATINAGTVTMNNLGSGGGTVTGPASLAANGIGSRQAVSFNGTSQYLKGSCYANTGTSMTAFIVGKSLNSTQAQSAGMMSVWGTNSVNDYDNAGNASVFIQNGATANSIMSYRNAALSSTTGTLTNPFVADALFNGTNDTMYLNGTAATAQNSSGSFSTTSLILGARWYANTTQTYWKGNIGEVLIYNTALSATDRQSVEAYLNNKWLLGMDNSNFLPIGTLLSIANGSTLDLNGVNQTIASLADSGVGGGIVTNSAASTATLTINPSSGSTTFSGAISGPISLVKSGAGTQVLAGASSYAGGTTVNNGTLLVNGSITGAVTVASGATLGGTGAITGNVTFASGARAVFTANATTDVPLSFSGPVTLNGNTVHLTLPDNLPLGTYVLATITNGGFTGNFALNPVIDSGSTVTAPYTNILMDASAVRLVVSATPIIVLSSTLPSGMRGVGYSQTITAIGGTVPYAYALYAGTLPSGLTLSSAGALSGNPDTVGTYNFTVQATDAGSFTGTQAYSLTILPNASNFSWASTVSSDWSVAGNWTNDIGGSVAPLTSGNTNYILNFNQPGTYTATQNLTDGFLLNQLNFGSSINGLTLAGNSMAFTNNAAVLPQINQNSTAGIAIGNNLVLGANTTLGGTGSGAVTLSGGISGAGSLTKTISGTLTLSGANTYTGKTTLNGGTLSINSLANAGVASALGAPTGANGTIDLYTGATLSSSAAAGTTDRVINLAGGTGTATITTSSGALTLNGNITSTATGATTLKFLSDSLTANGVISDSSGGTTSLSAQISNNGGVALYGLNTFSGSVTLNAGANNGAFYFNSLAPTGSASSFGTGSNSGTINMAGSASTSFQYYGGAATTDRVISMSGSYVNLKNNGSGGLTFTGTFRSASGANTLGLGGSYTASANTISGVIENGSGTTSIDLNTSGTWILSGNNTFTGGNITINHGTLSVSSLNNRGTGGLTQLANSNLGVPAAGTGTITFNDGGAAPTCVLLYTGAGETTDRPFVLYRTNGGNFYIVDSGTGLLKFTGNMTGPSTAYSMTLQGSTSGSAEYAGVIANGSVALGITKSGTGTWTLSGANTYTGVTTISGGVLSVSSLANASSNSNLGAYPTAGAAGISLSGGTLQYAGASGVSVNRGITLAANSTVDVNPASTALTLGASTLGAATLNVTGGAGSSLGLGAATLTGAATLNPTTASLTVASVTATNQNLTLGGTATGNSVTGAIATGTGTLTKSGTSIWTLAGTNTYSGTTTVSVGTLAVTGTLGATAVTVSSAATLAGNGNIGGNVTIASGAHHALAVAATAGAQLTRAITGTLTMTGSILDLSAATTPASGVYVLATASVAITGTPTTINYTGINGGTVSVDTTSTPKRLLLTVTSSPYDTWANGTFVPPLTAKLPGDDQDGDGLTNLLEYAFGTQPTVSFSGGIVYVSGGTVTTHGQPVVFAQGNDYFTVFGRRTDFATAGITYKAQFSAGLDVWVDNDDVANAPVQVATDGTIDAVQVKYPESIVTGSGSHKPTFSRVMVTMP